MTIVAIAVWEEFFSDLSTAGHAGVRDGLRCGRYGRRRRAAALRQVGAVQRRDRPGRPARDVHRLGRDLRHRARRPRPRRRAASRPTRRSSSPSPRCCSTASSESSSPPTARRGDGRPAPRHPRRDPAGRDRARRSCTASRSWRSCSCCRAGQISSLHGLIDAMAGRVHRLRRPCRGRRCSALRPCARASSSGCSWPAGPRGSWARAGRRRPPVSRADGPAILGRISERTGVPIVMARGLGRGGARDHGRSAGRRSRRRPALLLRGADGGRRSHRARLPVHLPGVRPPALLPSGHRAAVPGAGGARGGLGGLAALDRVGVLWRP